VAGFEAPDDTQSGLRPTDGRPTEFEVRDIILRVAAKAYEEHLAQKQTATKGPA
jgi:hypothetical protein